MEHTSPITQEEMVAVFLKTELHSTRFRERVLAVLHQLGIDPAIVGEPDIGNAFDNAVRLQILGEYRGYGLSEDMFEDFPAQVSWYRAHIRPAELAAVQYIDYSYWNALSGGTRLPVKAVENIRSGMVVYGISTQPFWHLAQSLRAGAVFPELILVGTAPGMPLVVMEGHARLTGCFLASECIPAELGVIVGYSPVMTDWGCYGEPGVCRDPY